MNENDTISLNKFNEKNRSIYIFNDIDEAIALNIQRDINRIICDDNSIIAENKKALSSIINEKDIEKIDFNKYIPEVNIYLNTFGGSVYDGLSIYDSISVLNKHCKVNITVTGKCMSAGILILLAVPYKQRFGTEQSTFMIHQASSFNAGMAADLEDQTAEVKRITDIVYKIIMENTDITQEDVDKNYNMKKDWILTSEEAKNLKLIYKIK